MYSFSSWWEHGDTQADVVEEELRELHLDPRQQEKLHHWVRLGLLKTSEPSSGNTFPPKRPHPLVL